MAGVSVVTLAEPDDNCGLTTKLLKVRVVKLGNTVQTKSSNGSDFEILNFSVADSTMALLANCSDAFKMAAIKEGRTLHIRNYSIKNRRLTIGTKARVLQGLAMVVSEELQKRARELICPPSPQKRISEVGNAMKGEILTVVGQVVKDQAPMTVQVNGRETKIRTITLQDGSGRDVDLTLWREMGEKDLGVGQWVKVTSCCVSVWNNATTLNTTRNSDITFTQPEQSEIRGQLERVLVGDVETELCISVGGEYRDFMVDNSELQTALQIQNENLQEEILAILPITVNIRAQGNTVVNLTRIQE